MLPFDRLLPLLLRLRLARRLLLALLSVALRSRCAVTLLPRGVLTRTVGLLLLALGLGPRTLFAVALLARGVLTRALGLLLLLTLGLGLRALLVVTLLARGGVAPGAVDLLLRLPLAIGLRALALLVVALWSCHGLARRTLRAGLRLLARGASGLVRCGFALRRDATLAAGGTRCDRSGRRDPHRPDAPPRCVPRSGSWPRRRGQ